MNSKYEFKFKNTNRIDFVFDLLKIVVHRNIDAA